MHKHHKAREPVRFGCGQCFGGDAQAAWENRQRLSEIATLVDESHFDLRLVACPDCGQRFLWVFTELIDWQEGDDSQAWCLLPLTEPECARLQAMKDPSAVEGVEGWCGDRPYLMEVHPSGKDTTVVRVEKGFRFLPHD
ncbi:MAG: hypothetical protein HY927_09065 [Elusimicrobia bacterium]|nr:hypothetical protein [Elusimicrobiota bacterium]